MRAGSKVVLVDDPLKHGIGEVKTVRMDGKLGVEWDYDEHLADPPIRAYNTRELEEYEVWLAREGTLDEIDLSQLRRGDSHKS